MRELHQARQDIRVPGGDHRQAGHHVSPPCSTGVAQRELSGSSRTLTVTPPPFECMPASSTRSVAHNAQDGLDKLRTTTTQTANRHENRISVLENMVAQLAAQLAQVRSGGPHPIQPAVGNGFGKVEIDEPEAGSSRLGDGLIDTEAEAASTLELCVPRAVRACPMPPLLTSDSLRLQSGHGSIPRKDDGRSRRRPAVVGRERRQRGDGALEREEQRGQPRFF